MQILIQEAWGGTQESSFLTSSLMMMLLPINRCIPGSQALLQFEKK